jgi:Cu(I)/Ag(I) efflux system membrane protein CusA/SilA
MQDMLKNIEIALKSLKNYRFANNGFGPIPLETVANVKISDGSMINSENAMLRGRCVV